MTAHSSFSATTMNTDHQIAFQFISEPTDVNFGGKVHGGAVMKWIDQTAYTCARAWAGSYCVTVYVGGIRFYKPINIGDLVRVEATIIHTGTSSIHIAIDVYARSLADTQLEKKTHCVIVFVAVDEQGKATPVRQWTPRTAREQELERYAMKLKSLSSAIEEEMRPFLADEG